MKQPLPTMGISPARPIYKNDHLHPTKRGWLFMGRHGGPCDKACKMCYYSFQSQLVFYSLDTLMGHANMYRYHYGLEYCDISGGEATIMPGIEKLVAHCRAIGLLPTIITHGQNNTEAKVKGLEDAGLEDWLISIHGMGTGHDNTVVNHKGVGTGGWKKLTANLPNCTRPTRFNTTLQNFNYAEVPDLARWLVDNRPPTVWNMIQFNPFYAWDARPEIDFQSTMTELAPFVAQAVEIAEAGGWEVNVRYFPFCVADEHGFAKNCINFYQTQYDPWEWCLAATNRMPMQHIQSVGGIEAARRLHCDEIAKSRDNDKCRTCSMRAICEGPSAQYLKRYGNGELRPYTDEAVSDIGYWENVH